MHSTVNSIFSFFIFRSVLSDIRINCSRVSEGLLYFPLHEWPWLPYLENRTEQLGRTLSEHRTTTNSVPPVEPVSTESTLRVWVPRRVPLLYRRYYPCSAIWEDGLHKLLKFIQNGTAVFVKTAILCFRAHILLSQNVPIHRTPTYDG
jgi:hypothetical protein